MLFDRTILDLISPAIFMNASVTFTPDFALVSANGIPNSSASACPRAVEMTRFSSDTLATAAEIFSSTVALASSDGGGPVVETPASPTWTYGGRGAEEEVGRRILRREPARRR